MISGVFRGRSLWAFCRGFGPALVVSLLLIAFATAGCSNTCPYGSKGAKNSSGDCKSRPDPSADELTGYRTADVAPRLKEIRRRGITAVNGIRVNRWGEMWVTDSSGKTLVLDHNNKEVDPKDDWETTGHNSFSAEKAKPAAIDTALAQIRRIAPDFDEFNDADLWDFGVGERAGVRWYVTVQNDGTYRTFLANSKGKLVAELDREHGGLKSVPA